MGAISSAPGDRHKSIFKHTCLVLEQIKSAAERPSGRGSTTGLYKKKKAFMAPAGAEAPQGYLAKDYALICQNSFKTLTLYSFASALAVQHRFSHRLYSSMS